MRQGGLFCEFVLILVTTACKQTLSITRDTWCEHKGTYLSDFITDYGTDQHNTLDGAKTDCLKESGCGGITYEPESKMYFLRHGKDPINGSSGQISWTRCTVEDSVEKLEISSGMITTNNSWSSLKYEMINAGNMIDGDRTTSGIMYLAPNMSSLNLPNSSIEFNFEMRVYLTEAAEIHAVHTYTTSSGNSSMLTFKDSVYISPSQELCGTMPETIPSKLRCEKPVLGNQVSFFFYKQSTEHIPKFILEVNEIEIYGKILPKTKPAKSACFGRTFETMLIVIGAVRLL